MSDKIFHEYLIKKLPDRSSFLIKASTITAALLLSVLLIVLLTPIVNFASFVIAATLSGLGIYFVFRSLDIEYEYILADGELTIDKITARSQRTNILQLDIRTVEAFRQIPAGAYREENTAVIEYSVSPDAPDRWVAIYTTDGVRTALVIAPPPSLLDAIRAVIPGKMRR